MPLSGDSSLANFSTGLEHILIFHEPGMAGTTVRLAGRV